MTRRLVPCDGCRKAYTAGGAHCASCAALVAQGLPLPPQPDRFAELLRHACSPVDRHAAITKLTDYIASGALTDVAVKALLAHAEILKGRAA